MPALLSFSTFGPPAEVLQLIEEELPLLEPNEVKIRMRMAPINPSDLNYIEGTYGIKPVLPAIAGLEGVGEITALGASVQNYTIGQLVRPDRRSGLWREEMINAASAISPFPPGLTVEQASVTSVNPPTAWCLLKEFVSLEPGDWVIQNAANSGVGRAVIQLAHAFGLRTINLVRRSEWIPLLQAEGADLVLVPDDEGLKHIKATVGKAPIKLALNAVGGESALTLAKALTSGGVHVTYGAMARQPVKIPNGLLIFQDLTFRGFWVIAWLQKASPARVAEMWTALAHSWQTGILTPGLEKAYSLKNYQAALTHAQQESRQGKIVFQMV